MKDLNYWKNNCEEDYINTPISVLRYITELEKAQLNMREIDNKYGLLVLNQMERNVLMVALDHMQEHLESLLQDYQCQTSLNDIEERLKALETLKSSLK